MSWIVTVHKYKYSQQSRRNILKKLAKQGYIKYEGQTKEHYHYLIPNNEAMEEYKKRKGK